MSNIDVPRKLRWRRFAAGASADGAKQEKGSADVQEGRCDRRRTTQRDCRDTAVTLGGAGTQRLFGRHAEWSVGVRPVPADARCTSRPRH
jgi:hypothetical protein